MEFDFEVLYQPGVQHQAVDGMSRLSRAYRREGDEIKQDTNCDIAIHFNIGQIPDAIKIPQENAPV